MPKVENFFKTAANYIKIGCAFVGGALGKLLGGWDQMLVILVILIVLDYVSGIIKSVYQRSLSSEVGWKGILKKVMFLVTVMVAYLVQQVIGNVVPLREIVIAFFIANEALSILENGGAMGIKYPKKLLDVLKQLHDDSDEGKLEPKKEDYIERQEEAISEEKADHTVLPEEIPKEDDPDNIID